MAITNTTIATSKTLALQIPDIDDDAHYICLWGYASVLPTSRSWLDREEVVGGVIRNVPGKQAKEWKRNRATAKIVVMPDDASESDFMRAAGVRPEDMLKIVNTLAGIDPQELIERLGSAKARNLASALQKYLDEK